jgi:hypothetical protein
LPTAFLDCFVPSLLSLIATEYPNIVAKSEIMGGAPVNSGAAVYDAVLHRRQALMGASGARALVKNFRVFAIASFACIGGVLYGYNQGMFSGVLAMPAFKERK